MKLMIATKNKNKVQEFTNLLKDYGFDIYSFNDFPDLPEIVEDGKTLHENALKKAKVTAQLTNMISLSDDTGLFIDALNGEPGIYSARYAGENCSYQDNRQKVLSLMKEKQNRKARFITNVVICDKDGNQIASVDGQVEGEITQKEIGKNGFGYDSIFRCDETGLTFGEMDEESKNEISHRGRAFKKAIKILLEL